jgi:hypothetical protein
MEIEIKSIFGKVLFVHDSEDNNIRKTLEQAIKSSANLRTADLSSANLSSANLNSADLRYANLSSANLSYSNLRSANLRYADLSYSDLSYSNLSYSNLSSANLRSADLRYANLNSADLSYSNLSSANLDKRYIQIGCVGSVKRITTYCFDDDIIWCGCFVGNLEQFERQVKETHKNSQQYLKEYLGFINYIKSLK